ncbi:Uncharacterized [Syntrophomonas zehnderi OL-4]|uniref:Uncharacterized n=1 Tax=Syntrophomonas zehnderi OL-4 TaxID=690567 RepID=A0A0E4GB46_9FIRM|nr:CD1871A family CXXC motif-containing protein [Syntrophomonas zehnderi]CFX74822.1 Uncharacterized [Syntrophomonas zehnderi OL-4]
MDNKLRQRISVGLLAGSGLLISLGIFRGEVGIVFSKAINICLECIGLG